MTRHVLKSEQVLLGAAPRPACLLIHEGKLEAILPHDGSGLPEGVPVADHGDALIMPGLCDTHVHLNEPGRTAWEGFVTGTRAAAAGGVTTLVDMPLNCLPVTTTAEALGQKLQAAEGALSVDVGFWGGVVPDHVEDLPALAAAGVLGAKAFLCDSGIEEFPASDAEVLRRAMQRLAEAGLPLLAHAELPGGEIEAGDPHRYADYLASRPASWENDAIALLIRLCRETGCAVHIVHLSAASALPALQAARREGLPIHVETCPHYLTLAAEDIADGQTEMKCAPPIRARANRELLWQGLRDGVIDLVTTDHSPCTPALKCQEEGDFHAAWGGIASLQLGLPLVWSEARARGFGHGDLARWLAAAPAALAGLHDRKGRIAPGYDADFVVWDPDAAVAVEAERLYARHKLTPYLGRTLTGRVLATYLRGQCVYRDPQVAARTGEEAGVAATLHGRPLLGRATEKA